MHPDRRTMHHGVNVKRKGAYVLYWMQNTQRIEDNFALCEAVEIANRNTLPLRVLFVVDASFPETNKRHYRFLLEGIAALYKPLADRNIDFVVETGSLFEAFERHAHEAAAIVLDRAYLDPLRALRLKAVALAKTRDVFCVEVESDTIVPVQQASHKAEYAARTIRPKLHANIERYFERATPGSVKHTGHRPGVAIDINRMMKRLETDAVPPVTEYFPGGEDAAAKRLETYLHEGLPRYLESNDPANRFTSRLSPYLHFGHISPMAVYDGAMRMADAHPAASEAFVEQLLIRRELAYNFVWYTTGYNRFETMSEPWAYRTMAAHEDDVRARLYTREDYEHFATDDAYFNAAMTEMVKTGFMHNTMRMYWGKKIIAWSQTAKTAYETILHLNNKYFLDGRDANSYAGVAWLFGKHDRGFGERPVFGTLRTMTSGGLKRKYDMAGYLEYVSRLQK